MFLPGFTSIEPEYIRWLYLELPDYKRCQEIHQCLRWHASPDSPELLPARSSLLSLQRKHPPSRKLVLLPAVFYTQ